MKKSLVALLSTAAVVAGAMLPASAAETGDPLYSAIMMPIRLAALGTGVVVGSSVSAVKNSANQIPELTSQIANGLNSSEDPVTMTVASIPAVPLGLLIGVAQGVHDGTANAFEHSFDRPFSAESFSLSTEK